MHIHLLACLVWYAISALTSQLTRLVLSRFNFPLCVSLAQFFISSALALAFTIVIRAAPRIGDFFVKGTVPDGHTPSPLFNWRIMAKVAPLSVFQFTGKFCSLSATALVLLATVSSIKALSPLLIVIGYRIFYNVQFPLVTYLSLIPLIAGVLMIVLPETPPAPVTLASLDRSHVTGIIFCVISTIIFAAQNIYGRELMTWDAPPAIAKPYRKLRRNSLRLPYSVLSSVSSDSPYTSQAMRRHKWTRPWSYWHARLNLAALAKPDKISIILYCSILGLCFSLVGFLQKELPIMLDRLQLALRTLVDGPMETLSLVGLLVLDSASMFAQTLLAFHMLGLLPALSYSIASMMKRIVLILSSIVLTFGAPALAEKDSIRWWNRVSPSQICGMACISLGLYCYDRYGSKMAI